MIDLVLSKFINSGKSKNEIDSFFDINTRFIKEVQESFSVVIVALMNDIVFNQGGKIRLLVTVEKAKELDMFNDLIDLTSSSTRSIALEPTTGVFSLDISINGKGNIYTFKSSELETIDVIVLNDNGEEESIPLEEMLTRTHSYIMSSNENKQETPEDLPENVIRGNFGK